ncbi:hypothetical protein I79_006959 [Cricetulus griseus]|uniref:Uncharacterized protein n=1 Tax=Cricetulus griseus TaxID=10029 RepID=G3H993_CRIGR|nr:hypothetical protein I79_006959 [Cricetulus griseus]
MYFKAVGRIAKGDDNHAFERTHPEEPPIDVGNTRVKAGTPEVVILSVVNKPVINIKQPLPKSVL